MNRSEIREQAFKLIYSLEIQNIENLEEQIELYIESNNITDKNAIEYIKDSVLGIKKKWKRYNAKNRNKFKIRLENRKNF